MNSLILVHGALSNATQMQGFAGALKKHFRVYNFQFPFHAKEDTIEEEKFRMEFFAEHLFDFTKAHSLSGAGIFGYSMGGYAALTAECFHPGTFGKIITLGTKFHWTKETAEAEAKRLNPAIMQQKIPAYTAQLKALFGEGWTSVVNCTARLMLALGNDKILYPEKLKTIPCPVIILRGENDNMVSRAESLETVSHLFNAAYHELKNCSHPFEQAETNELLMHFGF